MLICSDEVSLFVITFQVVCEGVKEYHMKNKVLKATLAVAALGGSCMLSVANAAHISIPAGGFGVSNNFIDNGVITTEYRENGEVWEWLDLTVTNGISHNSIVADLLNDGSLNNSDGVLNANDGAKADVAALSAVEASGWSTVNLDDVTSMFNDYFGFTDELVVNSASTAAGASLTEDFIALFGDTYHEGYEDIGTTLFEADPQQPNVGYTYGGSETMSLPLYNFAPMVYDGRFKDSTRDFEDFVQVGTIVLQDVVEFHIGSWLARQVIVSDGNPQITSVPEPSSITIFSLALLGLVSLRRKFAA